METLNNLAMTATNRLLASAMGHALDSLQTLMANGGRDRHCKFYYDFNNGGNILQVLTKSVVGGVVDDIANIAVNHFNALFDKKSKQYNSAWIDSEIPRIKNEKDKYGKIDFGDKGTVFAVDDWGLKCPDALMLCIDVEKEVTITQQIAGGWGNVEIGTTGKKNKPVYGETQLRQKNIVKTNNIVWYDTTALVNVSSDKNIISTRIVGRDYSRKELISNGDIKFSVSGQITSGRPDIYPTEEVAKFLKVMKYKGIVKVNNQILDQFGVEYIVITDFNMSAKEGNKSTQQYSFSAIGLQPAQETEITEDTIVIVPETVMPVDDDNAWVKMFKGQLDNLKELSKGLFSQAVAIGTGALTSEINKGVASIAEKSLDNTL